MTADLTIAAQVAEAFAAEQRDLAAAGLPGAAAGPGERRPDGNPVDVTGQPRADRRVTAGTALGNRRLLAWRHAERVSAARAGLEGRGRLPVG